MGLISSPIGAADGREELEPLHDEAAAADLRPFSHDSHFSVSPQSAQGYRFQVIEEIIVIGANGRIVAVEPPQFPVGEGRGRGAMPVPVAGEPKRQDALRFLWGPGHDVLGPSGARRGLYGDLRAADQHLRFKALHHEVLEGVSDIALQAFLRFLQRDAAAIVDELPVTVDRVRVKLAFRFQYDEHYLHERHAAQLAWRRFLTGRQPGANRTLGTARTRP